MGAFLEQYGIAIFVLVILGIMVLMANGLGSEIKGKVSEEINKFTSSTKVANQTAQENSGYEGLDGVVGDNNETNSISFSGTIKDFYSLNTVFEFNTSGKTEAQLAAELNQYETTWDYDSNFIKISDEVVDNDTMFYIEHKFNNHNNLLEEFKNKTFKGGLTYSNETLRGHNVDVFKFENLGNTDRDVWYVMNVKEGFSYNQANDVITTLTEGLWIPDSVGMTFLTMDYLKISKLTPKVDKTINGLGCVKVSNKVVNKDDLLNKNIEMKVTINGQVETISETITEDLLNESGSMISLVDTILFTDNGIYMVSDALGTGFDNFTIKIK